MHDIAPQYLCPACQRGVLNRRVSACLYCGAQLPAAVLATPAAIALAQDKERREREIAAFAPTPGPVSEPSLAAETFAFLLNL